MRAGALDKVVYEAAAARRAVLVASDGFEPLVRGIEPPLRFAQDDAASLAERILTLAALDAAQRAQIGAELRARVVRDHSVEHWAQAIVAAAR
jgi:glycosyltransferase involved in cell wall biosynthesis